jgi:hypothetical protein
MKQNRIEISSTWKKDLAHRYRTSLTTVQQSLDYYNNSVQAKDIRQDAKAMLIAEAEKIETEKS